MHSSILLLVEPNVVVAVAETTRLDVAPVSGRIPSLAHFLTYCETCCFIINQLEASRTLVGAILGLHIRQGLTGRCLEGTFCARRATIDLEACVARK